MGERQTACNYSWSIGSCYNMGPTSDRVFMTPPSQGIRTRATRHLIHSVIVVPLMVDAFAPRLTVYHS